jgi:hypothetical protein
MSEAVSPVLSNTFPDAMGGDDLTLKSGEGDMEPVAALSPESLGP